MLVDEEVPDPRVVVLEPHLTGGVTLRSCLVLLVTLKWLGTGLSKFSKITQIQKPDKFDKPGVCVALVHVGLE